MAEDKNIKNEVGSVYDYENYQPRTLRLQNDSFEQIINRSGRFRLYDDMIANEAIIGAFNNLLESYVVSEKFYFKPADTSDEAKEKSDLMWNMLEDMEVSFQQNLKDWLTFCAYGFSVNEILLKKRLGLNPDNPKKNSKYDGSNVTSTP